MLRNVPRSLNSGQWKALLATPEVQCLSELALEADRDSEGKANDHSGEDVKGLFQVARSLDNVSIDQTAL